MWKTFTVQCSYNSAEEKSLNVGHIDIYIAYIHETTREFFTKWSNDNFHVYCGVSFVRDQITTGRISQMSFELRQMCWAFEKKTEAFLSDYATNVPDHKLVNFIHQALLPSFFIQSLCTGLWSFCWFIFIHSISRQ